MERCSTGRVKTNLVDVLNFSCSRKRSSLVLFVVHVEGVELIQDDCDVHVSSHLDDGGEGFSGDDLASTFVECGERSRRLAMKIGERSGR